MPCTALLTGIQACLVHMRAQVCETLMNDLISKSASTSRWLRDQTLTMTFHILKASLGRLGLLVDAALVHVACDTLSMLLLFNTADAEFRAQAVQVVTAKATLVCDAAAREGRLGFEVHTPAFGIACFAQSSALAVDTPIAASNTTQVLLGMVPPASATAGQGSACTA